MNEDYLIDNIIKTNFEGIYEELVNKSYKDTDIFNIVWEVYLEDMEQTNIYLFFLYMLSKNNNEAFWHEKCCLFLAYHNVLFHDGMSLAAWHIRKAVELEPENYEYQKLLINTFYTYPNDYFTKEEYIQFAQNVLTISRQNKRAKEILKNYINK